MQNISDLATTLLLICQLKDVTVYQLNYTKTLKTIQTDTELRAELMMKLHKKVTD